MSDKYEITKMYRRNQRIPVTKQSLIQYNQGKRNTIEHLLGDVIVDCKPLYQYNNYYVMKRVGDWKE